MAFTNPFPSLLGMNNQQPDPYQSLLGEYYDPRQARMAWLGGTLQAAGAGLATGKPGAWAAGAALGGTQGVDDYRQRAAVMYGMQQRKEERDYQRQQQEQEAEAKRQQEEAQAAAIAGLPPEMQPWAKAYPSAVIPSYVQQKYFPDPVKVDTPAAIQEYQYAVSQGFEGSYMDYQAARKGNGITVNPDGTVQIGGPGGKPSADDKRATALASQIISQEPELMAGFDSLASPQNYAGARLPGGSSVMSPEAQVAQDAITNTVANWLYLTSGATATDAEIERQTAMVTPSPMDSPQRKAAKKARLKSIFDTMRARGGIAPEVQTPSVGGSANPSVDDLIKQYGGDN